MSKLNKIIQKSWKSWNLNGDYLEEYVLKRCPILTIRFAQNLGSETLNKIWITFTQPSDFMNICAIIFPTHLDLKWNEKTWEKSILSQNCRLIFVTASVICNKKGKIICMQYLFFVSSVRSSLWCALRDLQLAAIFCFHSAQCHSNLTHPMQQPNKCNNQMNVTTK